MAKKLGKILIPAATIIAALTMTGCSGDAKDRATHIQDNLIAAATERQEGIQDFRLIGTEVDKTGFVFDVNFNGVAKLDDGSQAYTTFNYKIPSDYFVDLQKNSSITAVYNVFDQVVENNQYTTCTIIPVHDIKYVNSALVNNAPTPFADFNIRKGLVYNLSTPTFDDESHKVSFDVRTLMDLRKIKLVSGWGIGWNLFGAKFTFGHGITIRACEGVFVTDDTYKFTVDETTYNQMKEDNALVFTYVADSIYEKDDSKISADRNTTNYVTYDAADLLWYFDVNQASQDFSM